MTIYSIIKNERTLVVSLDFDRVKQGKNHNIGEFYYKGVCQKFLLLIQTIYINL